MKREKKGFCGHVFDEAERMAESRHYRTEESYKRAARKLLRYLGGKDMKPEAVTPETMQDFERSMLADGICPNTVSAYFRTLRAVYNRLVDEGVTDDRAPFRKVYTGVADTRKRAVPVDVVRKIREFRTDNKHLSLARDMFLFSFYTRGMSFVDMARLRKTSVRDGYLSYRRSKTGKMMRMRWEPCMAEIAARHAAPAESPYLLDLVKGSGKEAYRSYANAQQMIGRHVRRLGAEIGLEEPLTMYVARHSWATAAYSQDIPLSVISEGLGHDSEYTTRIYLASVDTRRVDEANEKVLRSVIGETK